MAFVRTTALILVAMALGGPGGRLLGQRLVKNEPLSIDQRPMVVLGASGISTVDAEDSLQLFARVRTPFVMNGDRVVVPLGLDLQIRVFDMHGRFLTEYGRAGSGPGEFLSLDAAWARGDTIEAYDSDQARITRFHDGRVISTIPVQVGLERPLDGLPGPLGEGWAFTTIFAAGSDQRDEGGVYRVSRDGTADLMKIRTLGLVRYTSPVMMGPTPLSPRSEVLSHGDDLYVAETLTPEVQIFNASGDQLGVVRWAPPPDEVSPSAAADRVQHLALAAAPADRKRFLQVHLGAARAPEHISVFSSFLVDSLGYLWVRPYHVDRDAAALGGPLGLWSIGPGGHWIIFAPDGKRVGEVTAPDELELQYIGLHEVVGIRKDSLGIEYVEVHRLQRAADRR